MIFVLFQLIDILQNMTIARQITTRSVSKSQTLHTMITRSGMRYYKKRQQIKKNIVKKESITTPPELTTPSYTRPPVLAECVPIAYRAIVEVLELYHKDPNELHLGWLQEAVSLTARLHRASLVQDPRQLQ